MKESSTSNESSPVNERQVLIEADDGVRLGATIFEVEAPRGTVVINAATGAPQGYYAPFAEFAARRGLRVITYDYRGIGRSRPETLRGFEAEMRQWGRLDAGAAFRFARTLDGAVPIAFVGHSFGAQVIGLSDELGGADAAVLVGGQLGYYRHWSGLPRLGLAALWHVGVPLLTAAHGYLPRRYGLRAELPAGVAREWARWCLSPDYFMSDEPDARSRFAAYRVPTLAFSATDDGIAPRPAVVALLQRLGGAVVRHRELRPDEFGGAQIGHFGFFRPRFESTLWLDAVRFIDDVFAGCAAPRTGAPDGPDRDRSGPSIGDIMADLSYGRA